MKKIQKVTLWSAVVLSLISWAFAFNSHWFGWFGWFGSNWQSVSTILHNDYTNIDSNGIKAVVPNADKTIVNNISNSIKSKIKTIDISHSNSITDVESTFWNNTDKTIVNNILSNAKLMKSVNNEIELPIDNLNTSKYRLWFYYKTITNTKFKKITIQTTNGLTNINTNLELSPWQVLRIILKSNKLKIIVDGKIAFSKTLSLNWKYIKLILNINKNLIFKDTKIKYIWHKYIWLRNKLLTRAKTHSSDNIIVNKKDDEAIGLYTAIDKNNTKHITWDKAKGKFVINTDTISQNILKLHLDPTLANKLWDNTSIYSILNNLKTEFNGLTFKSSNIDFDGNTKTKEYIYQDANWVNYIYQLKTNTSTNWNTKLINVVFKLIYQWTENVTQVKPIELDWNNSTKEWYYQNKNYATILQYKWDSMRRVLYTPNTKIYFNNLLTKNWVQWKVLFGLWLETTERSGKKYVTPFIKLYWFDKNKQKYYVKQVKDYTSFNTFNIKLNWNYIFKKDNWTVDYTKTDYLN